MQRLKMKSKCQFIGIGVQKSASTWVHRILEDHPDVLSPEPKELDYFSDNFSKGDDWYHSYFKNKSTKNQICGDISPSYFCAEGVVDRVYKYNPNIKIIVTLRDPYERALSNHLHLIRNDLYKDNNQGFCFAIKTHPEYIEQSLYYKHLSNWFKTFPRESFLILLQEDIKNNPDYCSKQIYSFLGIDLTHRSSFLFRKANVSFKPKNLFLDSLYKYSTRILSFIGLSKLVKMIKSQPMMIRLRDYNRGYIGNNIPQTSNAEKTEIMNCFSDDLNKLAKLLERDSFPWETWKVVVTTDIETKNDN